MLPVQRRSSFPSKVPFQPNNLVFGEKRYLASKPSLIITFHWPSEAGLIFRIVLGYLQKDFAGVIKALDDGSLKPEKMITSKIKIDRVVEDGYKALIEEKDKHVKILVDCRA